VDFPENPLAESFPENPLAESLVDA